MSQPSVVLTEEQIIDYMLATNTSEQARKDAVNAEVARLQAENAALRASQPNKPARSKQSAGTPKAWRNPAPAPITIGLPEVGTLDATTFLAKMRSLQHGGSTSPDWKTHTSITDRASMIRLIAGYCGYDTRGDFGAQDLAAREQAKRELSSKRCYPINSTSTKPSSTMAVAEIASTYDIGKPAPINRERDNLLAREQQTVDTILSIDKDSGLTMMQRAIKLGQEKARLASIREQLASIGAA